MRPLAEIVSDIFHGLQRGGPVHETVQDRRTKTMKTDREVARTVINAWNKPGDSVEACLDRAEAVVRKFREDVSIATREYIRGASLIDPLYPEERNP